MFKSSVVFKSLFAPAWQTKIVISFSPDGIRCSKEKDIVQTTRINGLFQFIEPQTRLLEGYKKSSPFLRAPNHKVRQQILNLIHERGEITVSEIYAKLKLEI